MKFAFATRHCGSESRPSSAEVEVTPNAVLYATMWS